MNCLFTHFFHCLMILVLIWMAQDSNNSVLFGYLYIYRYICAYIHRFGWHTMASNLLCCVVPRNNQTRLCLIICFWLLRGTLHVYVVLYHAYTCICCVVPRNNQTRLRGTTQHIHVNVISCVWLLRGTFMHVYICMYI